MRGGREGGSAGSARVAGEPASALRGGQGAGSGGVGPAGGAGSPAAAPRVSAGPSAAVRRNGTSERKPGVLQHWGSLRFCGLRTGARSCALSKKKKKVTAQIPSR